MSWDMCFTPWNMCFTAVTAPVEYVFHPPSPALKEEKLERGEVLLF